MESSRVMKWVKTAGAGALAFMLAAPTFAQSRGDARRGDSNRGRTETRNDSRNNSRGHDDNRSENRSYRDNDRVTVQGKVTSFSRERDGYRVQLDRNRGSYWVPDSYFHNNRGGRNRGLQVGVSIVLGGIWRGGSVYVDDVNWPDDGYYGSSYGSDYVAGYVERLDYRRGIAEVRDERSGRTVVVEFRNGGRYERLNFEDMRRGDFVEVSGAWNRGGVFTAYDIQSIRNGRR